MSLGELRELLERHARPNPATAVDGVRICRTDYVAGPQSSMSGTVLAVVAQGGKPLALGDHFYDYRAGQYLVGAIIGPHTMEQLDDLLAGADVTLDNEVLDRIDEIAPPGTDAGPNTVAYTPPAISDVSLRRRAVGERSAA
jgi:hypothetical protein